MQSYLVKEEDCRLAQGQFMKHFPRELLEELATRLPRLQILKHLSEKVYVIKYFPEDELKAEGPLTKP